MSIISASDITTSGNITSNGQSITLALGAGQSSWNVQVTGTFVATMVFEISFDGTNYEKVSQRQTVTGWYGNTITNVDTARSTIFRGNASGVVSFRVRSTAYTSGTAVVTIRASSGTGAVFLNTFIESRSLDQYYAAVAGKNMLFGAVVQAAAVSGSGGPIAMLENPAANTVDLYISRFVISCDKDGRLERYRNPTITGRTTAATAVNRGGGSNVTLAKLYDPSNYTTSANGTLEKVSYISASNSETTLEDGTIILRPGNALLWRFIPNTNAASNAAVEAVWWETVATT